MVVKSSDIILGHLKKKKIGSVKIKIVPKKLIKFKYFSYKGKNKFN